MTPREVLELVRIQKNIPEDVPMTYAGRLDPSAEGLLIVLVGDVVHEKDAYSHLDKTYAFSVLCGVSTDTGDILGKITHHTVVDESVVNDSSIQNALDQCSAIREQVYPMYSSKTVDGVPLWQYARNNEKPKILPIHSVSITFVGEYIVKKISSDDVRVYIEKRIALVGGDFRQEEILSSWNDFLKKNTQGLYVIEAVVDVSSGTYIRVLCEEIGKVLGFPALAWSIKRTRVGDHTLDDTIKIEK
jgi:tRNA pseudouridine55 synthase